MTAKVLDGKALSAKIRLEISYEVKQLAEKISRPPGLAVILVGEDPASSVYVRNKRKACAEVGIFSQQYLLPTTTSEAEILHLIDQLNQNTAIDGILVQLPLPTHMNCETVVERIQADKDIDGFHPYNIGRLAIRLPTLRSCTPWGIMALLDATAETYHGREAVVVGASNHVGRPMALELLLAGCTVTICHRFTRDLRKHVEQAEILVVAVGKPGVVKGEWIKPGATVIDVGINRLPDGRLIGDIEFAEVTKRAGWLTPVPGGVGPMTVAMLLKNTLLAAKSRHPGSH